MITSRGGLPSFASNPSLLISLLWLDLHTSTAFRTPPSFPLISLPPAPPLPDTLLEAAAYTSPTSPLHLPLCAIDCFNILYRLHRLALAVSDEWIGEVSRECVGKGLYEVGYMLGRVEDHSRGYLDFDLSNKVESEDDGAYETRAEEADASSIVEGLVAACQIFLYAALRGVPIRARLFVILAERLRGAVERPGVDTVQVWKEYKIDNLLLWAMVVGALVVGDARERRWWVERVGVVAREMGVWGVEEVEGVLGRVAWMEGGFGEGLGGLWREVVEVGWEGEGWWVGGRECRVVQWGELLAAQR